METLKKFLEESGVKYEISDTCGITCYPGTRLELVVFERDIEDMNYDLLSQILNKVEKWGEVADREELLVFNSAKDKYLTTYDRIVFKGRHLEVCELDKDRHVSVYYHDYLEAHRHNDLRAPEVVNHEFTFGELLRLKELLKESRRKAVIEKNNRVDINSLSYEDRFAAFKCAFPELFVNLTIDDVRFGFDGDWEFPVYLIEVSGHVLDMCFFEKVVHFEWNYDQTLATYGWETETEEKELSWGFVRAAVLESRKNRGLLMR